MQRAAECILAAYGRFVSPIFHRSVILPGGCRFSPTCSAYGLAAVRQYGLRIGFVLFLKRLGRCHPWASGGYDPIPTAGASDSS